MASQTLLSAASSGRDTAASGLRRQSFADDETELDDLMPHHEAGARNDDEGSPASEREGLMEHEEDSDFELGHHHQEREHKRGVVEDSPYPEVRAAVRNYDEDLPCNTIRAWTIGLFLTVFGASVNTLFSLRQPSISIGPLVAQIVAWPMGHGWARFVPAWQFTTFGTRWSLNPGPFNIKEHSIIVVMSGVSFSLAYATDIILAQVVFYKQDFGLIFQLLLTISTQSVGYGIAGVLRAYLVYPAGMIWPGNLAAVTLMNAMYEEKDEGDPRVIGGSMPRYRWFFLITSLSFLYYFIPGFFAKCLSVFAIATWMAPQSPIVNQLFGGVTGLSLIPITFDWTQIAGYVGSPMIPPWHATANTLIGVFVFFILGASFFHYGGFWYSAYLPMSDAATYDNTGASYNVSRVVNPDLTLNVEAYESYSPLFLSTTFAIAYGLSFAAIASLLVHTILNSGQQIWDQYKNSSKEEPDIHMKLMRKYKEAPTWWYMSLFVFMLAMGLYTILAYPTNMSWWSYLLAVGIASAFSLPIGIIMAVTNTQIGLNVLTEFIYGYIQPGRPLALMIFKTFGFITMTQALSFVEDLKFGHYMKIPPRTMFMAQVVATTFSCLIQITVLNLALNNIDQVCEVHQPNNFTCPGGRVFFAASVIWGLIGPSRIFSPGQMYSGLFWFFLLGGTATVGIFLASKRWPQSWARFLVAPLIFGGAGAIPPATPLNYLTNGIVAFTFNFWIKRRYFSWWSRLNFLTSSGLDLGLALGTLFIFFAFTLQGIKAPQWWGNTIVDTTMDVQGTAVQYHVADGETFGPKVW